MRLWLLRDGLHPAPLTTSVLAIGEMTLLWVPLLLDEEQGDNRQSFHRLGVSRIEGHRHRDKGYSRTGPSQPSGGSDKYFP